jgi:hypothetical protein
LGNCGLAANRQSLYDETREQVASFAIQKLIRQEPRLLAEYKEIPRSDTEISHFYQTYEDRLDFLERFKHNKEYSNEDIIQYSALFKRKIICIVEEEGDNRMSMICPGVPFRRENIIFLLHSNGNHYETFQYPIYLSDEMIDALKNLPVETVSKEYIMTMKDFTLDDLMSFILSERVKRRKNLNQRTRSKKASSAKHSRKSVSRTLVHASQTKLLTEFERRKQIENNQQLALQLNHNIKRGTTLRSKRF